MVRDFHRVIGREARAQILKAEGKLPAAIIACVGGGSNSIGIFYDFIKDRKVQLIGVEAGGRGEKLGDHAARFRGGLPGVLQGTYSCLRSRRCSRLQQREDCCRRDFLGLEKRRQQRYRILREPDQLI